MGSQHQTESKSPPETFQAKDATIVSPEKSPPSPEPVKSIKVDVDDNSKSDEPIGSTIASTQENKEGNDQDQEQSPNYDAALDTKRELPNGFKPTPYSVICGRGKECFESEGVSPVIDDMTFCNRSLDHSYTSFTLSLAGNNVQNKRFRGIINKFLNEYTSAPGKSEKSRIVSRAMNIIRDKSPEGAFVKFENGKWYELIDLFGPTRGQP